MNGLEKLLDQLAWAIDQIRTSVGEMARDQATIEQKVVSCERALEEVRSALLGKGGLSERVALLEARSRDVDPEEVQLAEAGASKERWATLGTIAKIALMAGPGALALLGSQFGWFQK